MVNDPRLKELLKDYEEVPKEAIIASKMLSDMYIRAGRPSTPFSEAGTKVMNLIIAVWEDLYPIEVAQWLDERKSHLVSEMSISTQVSQRTGRSLASFPWPIYQMIKKLFPLFKVQDRNTCIKMVKKWPMFKFVNQI